MNITTYAGDSLRLEGSVKSRLDSGDPLNLSTSAITFVASGVTGLPPTAVTVTKTVGAGITVLDGPNGFLAVDLTPTDTQALGADGGIFDYALRITLDPTHVHTVAVGQIKVLPTLA